MQNKEDTKALILKIRPRGKEVRGWKDCRNILPKSDKLVAHLETHTPKEKAAAVWLIIDWKPALCDLNGLCALFCSFLR